MNIPDFSGVKIPSGGSSINRVSELTGVETSQQGLSDGFIRSDNNQEHLAEIIEFLMEIIHG